MRVLVTGANGMLATNIIETLLCKGYQVRGVLRDIGKYRGAQSQDLELVEGDFTDLSIAVSAVEGCDCVIHTAAVTAQNLLRYEEYQRVNVDATTQLLKVAISKCVKRFIYVSTANTIGHGTPSNPSNESLPMMPPFNSSMYARSKREAEEAILELRDSIDVVVTNPTFMVGRYGTTEGSNRIFKMARRFVLAPNGGKNFISVDDAAEGIVAAMLRGRCGERYLICGENMSYREFFGAMPKVRYIINTPNWVLHFAGVVGDLLRRCGVKTDLSLTNTQMLSLNVGYSGEKATRELHFTARHISQHIDELLSNVKL